MVSWRNIRLCRNGQTRPITLDSGCKPGRRRIAEWRQVPPFARQLVSLDTGKTFVFRAQTTSWKITSDIGDEAPTIHLQMEDGQVYASFIRGP